MNAQAAAYFEQGVAAFGTADLAGAQQAFLAATRADARAYRAHFGLATVHERMGNVPAALAAYEQSFAAYPEFVEGVVAYARLQADSGNPADAERLLTQRRSALPKSAPLAAALAEVKSLMRDSATAQQIAQEALKLDPGCAPAMLAIARDHYRARRVDLALYALRAVLDGFGEGNPARDKSNVDARLLRATIYLEQDRRVLAMEDYKTVMGQRPDLVVPTLRYATYLLESGGARDAIPLLERVLRYDASNLGAHLSLGDANRLTGEYGKARQEFDWVKQQSGGLPAVHYNVGLLFLFAPSIEGMSAKEQLDTAIASLSKFKELASKAEQGDVEELLKRANLKKAELDALAAAAAASTSTPAPPTDGAAPAPPPPADGAVPAPPADGAVPAPPAPPADGATPPPAGGG
jgi:tetratricopeptide (TPR) repeat protein